MTSVKAAVTRAGSGPNSVYSYVSKYSFRTAHNTIQSIITLTFKLMDVLIKHLCFM